MKTSIFSFATLVILSLYCESATAMSRVKFEYGLEDGDTVTGFLEGDLVGNELQNITSAKIIEYSGNDIFSNKNAVIRRDIAPPTFSLAGIGQDFLSFGVYLEDVVPPTTSCFGFFPEDPEPDEPCDDAYLEITLFRTQNGFGVLESADFVNFSFEPDFNEGNFPAGISFSTTSNDNGIIDTRIISRTATVINTAKVPEPSTIVGIGTFMLAVLGKRILKG